MAKFIYDHFKCQYSSTIAGAQVLDLSVIPSIIDDHDNYGLLKPVSEEEVLVALTSIHGDKSLGPDGFPAAFYKKYWSSIKSTFMDAVQYFFSGGTLPRQWKSTFLVLIFKIKNPYTINDFRPISLCNISYKIISKIIVNRLKPLLQKIISAEQGTFLSGRCINDNVLLAQEILHSMRYRRVAASHVAVKVDMEKAYDMLHWDFIEATMIRFSFHPTFVNWIMNCIKNPCFSVLVNDSPTEWFESCKGLRQGDPIAPYLFIIAVEALIRGVKAKSDLGLVSGVHVGRGADKISQLNFADDCLLFFRASIAEAHHIKETLKWFCANSGEKVNLIKYKVYFASKVHQHHRRIIGRILGMQEGHWPMKYMGITMDGKRLPMQAYEPILTRIRGKLAGWKAKTLSFAGKLVLICSVVEAMPSYLLSNGWVPRRVLDGIEQAIRSFL